VGSKTADLVTANRKLIDGDGRFLERWSEAGGIGLEAQSVKVVVYTCAYRYWCDLNSHLLLENQIPPRAVR
jgi:hypothetical protein